MNPEFFKDTANTIDCSIALNQIKMNLLRIASLRPDTLVDVRYEIVAFLNQLIEESSVESM